MGLSECNRCQADHLRLARAVHFWASWQTGYGGCLPWRDEHFKAETVATLYEKVLAYQQTAEPDRRNG